jgi:hypothetical protein
MQFISRVLHVSCALKYENILLSGIRSVYFLNLGASKQKRGAATDRPHRPPGYVTVVPSQLNPVRNVTPCFCAT